MTGRRLLWLLPCVACTAAGERSPTRLGAIRSWEERWAGAGQHIVRSLWAAVRAVPPPYALRWSQHVVDAVNRGGADKRAAAFVRRCVVGRVGYRLTCGTHWCHRERGAASRSLLSDAEGCCGSPCYVYARVRVSIRIRQLYARRAYSWRSERVAVRGFVVRVVARRAGCKRLHVTRAPVCRWSDTSTSCMRCSPHPQNACEGLTLPL
jgi:hypothetical protein